MQATRISVSELSIGVSEAFSEAISPTSKGTYLIDEVLFLRNLLIDNLSLTTHVLAAIGVEPETIEGNIGTLPLKYREFHFQDNTIQGLEFMEIAQAARIMRGRDHISSEDIVLGLLSDRTSQAFEALQNTHLNEVAWRDVVNLFDRDTEMIHSLGLQRNVDGMLLAFPLGVLQSFMNGELTVEDIVSYVLFPRREQDRDRILRSPHSLRYIARRLRGLASMRSDIDGSCPPSSALLRIALEGSCLSHHISTCPRCSARIAQYRNSRRA